MLDNGVHDSTGGQATVSPNVDFAAVAQACGYPRSFRCDSEAGFARALEAAFDEGPRPVLIHALISPGSLAELGRPTIAPRDVARPLPFLHNGMISVGLAGAAPHRQSLACIRSA